MHTFGLSPVCVRMCIERYDDRENVLLHKVHEYGFDPVCVRMCSVRLIDLVNDLLHKVHGNRFPSLCDHLCPASSLETLKFKLVLASDVAMGADGLSSLKASGCLISRRLCT